MYNNIKKLCIITSAVMVGILLSLPKFPPVPLQSFCSSSWITNKLLTLFLPFLKYCMELCPRQCFLSGFFFFFFSINIMFLRLNHAVCISGSFLLIVSVLHCMNVPLFVYPCTCWQQIGLFLVRGSAALRIPIEFFVQRYVLFFLGEWIPISGIVVLY